MIKSPNPEPARTKFISPGTLVEGVITEVQINQDPFHCTIKIQPKDPSLIGAEGRYSDHEISLGKLKRNLVALKFNIHDVGDIIAAVESLEGRECIFRVDRSGWISWIPRLIEYGQPAPEPTVVPAPESVEIYFIREQGHKCIYRMQDVQGEVRGWAVGPTGAGTPKPHGWLLNLQSRDEAIQLLQNRKSKI